MSTTAPVPAGQVDVPARPQLAPATAASIAAYAVVVLVHLSAHLTNAGALANATQWVAVAWLLFALVAETRLRSPLARFTAGWSSSARLAPAR